MKKLISLILVLALVMPLSGCATKQRRRALMKGWEYVRIEKEVPQKDCKYIIQESCSAGGARCYNLYRQRAKLQGANVVVITDIARGQRSSGQALAFQSSAGASYNSVDSMTALADFYYCPNYKFGEQK